jgi:hypothetical protein
VEDVVAIAVVIDEHVVARPAEQPVGPRMPFQLIVTGAAMEAIAAEVPNQPVVGGVTGLPSHAKPGPSVVSSHRSSPKEVTRLTLETLPGPRRSCRGAASNPS